MMMLKQVLANTELLKDSSEELLQQVLDHANPMELNPGVILLSPEYDNQHIYILLSGVLTLHFNSSDDTVIHEFLPGQSVGEMSIIDDGKPSAYVKAKEYCQLFPLHRDFLHGLITHAHPVTRNLLRLLTRRMKDDIQRMVKDRLYISELTNQANVDVLTGLFNRRWLDNAFPLLLSQADQLKQTLCLLVIDIDYFKTYNDTHGHLGGDQALMSMATVLKTRIRPYDFAVRYGGEEFVVILPNTPQSEGVEIAEHIRAEIAQQLIIPTDSAMLSNITVSIGIATSNPQTSTKSIIAAADQKLYLAKQQGRNCVRY